MTIPVEQDLMFWYKLYVYMARPLAKLGKQWNVTRRYNIDGTYYRLYCLMDDPHTGFIKLTFYVDDLYCITFDISNTNFALERFSMENANNYQFAHPGMTRDEFDHHAMMIKLQVPHES